MLQKMTGLFFVFVGMGLMLLGTALVPASASVWADDFGVLVVGCVRNAHNGGPKARCTINSACDNTGCGKSVPNCRCWNGGFGNICDCRP